MSLFYPVRQKPAPHTFQKGDVLVLFGELFNRGYANGLVEEATTHGMTIIRATVGRRDENNQLRALTAEESENIPKPFINIPLEAGFDLETDDHGKTPNDYLKNVKLSDWQSARISASSLAVSREKGRIRFRAQTQKFLAELEKHILPGRHVHFAHLMAGGVPRCKIVMPLMNRVFKGIGDRFIASETFWTSGIGKVLEMNFHEVTAETFNILITESTALREKIKSQNGHVSYVAYGYHGTETLVNNQLQWQGYAPYIQAWAKLSLEDYSTEWSKKGIHSCIYNCPEILTNSSSLFQGLEIPLYNLIRSFDKENPNHPITQKMKVECKEVLKDDVSLDDVYKLVDHFLNAPETKNMGKLNCWPQHSTKEQLAITLRTSDQIIALHKDEKKLMTNNLSELIFRACGYIMLHDGYAPKHSVAWIGHDAVVKTLI
ncbi:MAG: hypothetical protein H7328_11250 [Bdellovibrio sp.]|nr:hypothetical protein [Bdellovibrio sp.]